jgi:hypothetical protein
MGWTTGRSRFDPRQRWKDFSSSLCAQTGSGAHPASCTMGTGGPLPGAWRWPLTPSSAEVMNEWELHLLPPSAFVACSGTALAFYLSFSLLGYIPSSGSCLKVRSDSCCGIGWLARCVQTALLPLKRTPRAHGCSSSRCLASGFWNISHLRRHVGKSPTLTSLARYTFKVDSHLTTRHRHDTDTTRQRHDTNIVTHSHITTRHVTTQTRHHDDRRRFFQKILPDRDCFTNYLLDWQEDSVEIFALMNVGNSIVTLW